MDIVHDADNAQSPAAVVEHLADGVAVGPIARILARKWAKSLIDHDDVLAFGAVVPGEVAAADSGAHGAQISGSDDVDERPAGHLVGRLDAFGPGHAPGAILAEGQVVGDAGSLDAGNGSRRARGSAGRSRCVSGAGRPSCGSAVVVVDLDGGGVFGLEAEIDIEDMEEAAQQQARADQQHAGESNLGDDENGADALVLAALARAEAGVLERLLQIAGGHAQAGDESEEDGGRDGDEDRPAEGGAVDVQAC